MVAAIILAGLTLFVGLTQTGINDSTRVVGRVMSGPHGDPVSNAWVVMTSDSEVAQTRTDARGRYAFLTLLPGVYRFSVFGHKPRCAVEAYYVANGTRFSPAARLNALDDPEDVAELSAGVEYLANLTITANCP